VGLTTAQRCSEAKAMEKEEALRVYSLFIGLKRPAMIFGVTQTFFVLSFLPCVIFFMVTMNIALALVGYLLLHLLGFICCYNDPFTFNILLGKYELVCPNRALWGCNSYDPQ
jgi:type IV secretion system protein VirB3